MLIILCFAQVRELERELQLVRAEVALKVEAERANTTHVQRDLASVKQEARDRELALTQQVAMPCGTRWGASVLADELEP